MTDDKESLIAFAKTGGPTISIVKPQNVGKTTGLHTLDLAAFAPALLAREKQFVDAWHPPETFDLVAHLERQRQFSFQTFGPGVRTKGVIDHIRKELIEIEAAPHDLNEWIDVILLACDGAWRAGHTPEAIAKALAAKLVRNEARTWPDWRTADPDKAIEHQRGPTETHTSSGTPRAQR
jgi:hypothetical protein